MTPPFTQKAQQSEIRWLSPLLPSILAAVSLIATVDSASLAAATECQVTENGGTIQAITGWKDTTSSILPFTITVERDIYGGLVASPVPAREVSPYMKSSRIARGNTESQGITTIGACVSQDILKSALFNQAMIKSIGKTHAKAHTPSMEVSALPYNGKRQVLKIRTTPLEIGVSVRYKTATTSGPVQEILKSILPHERSVSQAVAKLPSTAESPSLFGSQPFVALNPFQSALQPLDNESFRMNLTTTQALHSGNCVSGCP